MATKLSRVSYFGIPGSFTHQAAMQYFGPDSQLVSATAFRDVFAAVKKGKADRGIVPIENTLAGSVYENYDLLDEFDLSVAGEISNRVEHCLLVHKNNRVAKDLKSIKAVYSHPKALEQCSIFLEQHPWIKKVPHSDTATAAQYVGEQHDDSIAAIAGEQNADIYNLACIRKGIQNNGYNFTRFLVIATQSEKSVDDANKGSLIVRLPHATGSLSKMFAAFAAMDCNLTKIESRPLQDKPFEYMFYFDFLFDQATHSADEILAAIKKNALSVRVLGMYKYQWSQS